MSDFLTLKDYERELEQEELAAKTEFDPGVSQVKSTLGTSGIKLMTKVPIEYNLYQYILAIAKLDDRRYGLLFDRNTIRGYTVELVFVKHRLVSHRDLTNVFQDEEWATISSFFVEEKILEESSIVNMWLWSLKEFHNNPALMRKLMRSSLADIVHSCPDAVKNGTIRSGIASNDLVTINRINAAMRKAIMENNQGII